MYEKDVKNSVILACNSVILACPESFLEKDSRQAGMTMDGDISGGDMLIAHIYPFQTSGNDNGWGEMIIPRSRASRNFFD